MAMSPNVLISGTEPGVLGESLGSPSNAQKPWKKPADAVRRKGDEQLRHAACVDVEPRTGNRWAEIPTEKAAYETGIDGASLF